MYEVAVPGLDGRCWEVVEGATGARFSATLYRRSLQGVLDAHDRIATRADVPRAVAHAVDKAAAALQRYEQRGVCELRVNGLEIHEALEMSESPQ